MIKYYIKPNGTGTAYMVTCDTENEAQGELWSLQNKGVATEAEIVSPTSFIFFASNSFANIGLTPNPASSTKAKRADSTLTLKSMQAKSLPR
jgi:hypothetical protein